MAASTGGSHEMNGPKNGIACRMPDAVLVTGMKSRPRTMLVTAATAPYTAPMSACPRRKPPNDWAITALQEGSLVRVVGRHQAEQERQDPVTVDDHVQRQNHDDQQIPKRADARNRELLQRPHQLARIGIHVGEEHVRLGGKVNLAQAHPIQPRLPRRKDLRQPVAQARDAVDEVADRGRHAGSR